MTIGHFFYKGIKNISWFVIYKKKVYQKKTFCNFKAFLLIFELMIVLTEIIKGFSKFVFYNVQRFIFLAFMLLFVFTVPGLSAQQQKYDSLFSEVDELLDRSLPDDAVPLLLNIVKRNSESSDIRDFAHIQLAEAYRMKKEYKKATELLYSVLRNQNIKARNKAYAFNRMAALYNEWLEAGKHRRDSSFKYSLLCMEISEKHNFLNLLALSQNELAYIYRLRSDYDNALKLSLKAYNNFYDSEAYPNALNAAINVGGVYLALGDFQKGLQLLDTASQTMNPREYMTLFMRKYLRKSDFYIELGNYESAFYALDSARKLQNSVFEGKMNKQINEMTAKYDLRLKEQEIFKIQQLNKIQQQRTFYLSVLSVVLMVILLTAAYIFRLRQKLRQQAELIIKQENTELKAALDFKLEELRYKGRELSKATGNIVSFNDALKKIKQAVLKGDTKSAVEIINDNRNPEHNWDKFRLSFEEVYPNFMARLHKEFPNITENDGKLCAFLLLEMKTREIADITGISESSVSKNRNRLRKKLHLEKAADISRFLKTFS
jgi:tetratricopeptide (TPR) repeat protein